MQYALKLKSNPSNPSYETVFEPQYKTLFENKPNMIPSFGIKISSEFENINLDLDDIADYKISDVPPWTFCKPRVLFSLHNDKKSQTDPTVFQTKFHELLSAFPSYEPIFTDGSKDGDTAGLFSRRAVVSYWRKYVHEVLVNRLGGLSMPRKSVGRAA